MSDYRRIKECPRYFISDYGAVFRYDGLVMSPQTDRHGYKFVKLLNAEGVTVTRKVHRIVATEFIKRLPGKNIVCHLDHNPAHNSLGNLNWVTQRENIEQSMVAGRRNMGHTAPQSKLTETDVHSIMGMYYAGRKRKDIAIFYKVSTGAIDLIVTKKTWRHIWKTQEMYHQYMRDLSLA